MRPIDSFRNRVIQGDCIEIMKEIPDNSIDAVCTDPPYNLHFMSKEWDKKGTPKEYQAWTQEWATEVMRVLKPGAHMLVFAIPRMYHRMVCGVEDAGFDIHDQIDWIQGAGFPKGLDLSKAIDKHFGKENERKIIYENPNWRDRNTHNGVVWSERSRTSNDTEHKFITKLATPEAQQWEGWKVGKQALKPAHEPICLAQKPISERNIAENVLEWGTGGLNINGCRIPTGENISDKSKRKSYINGWRGEPNFSRPRIQQEEGFSQHIKGRFPANLVLSHDKRCSEVRCHPECPVRLLDEQSGIRKSGKMLPHHNIKEAQYNVYGKMYERSCETHGDKGGASRFFQVFQDTRFKYCPKASPHERNAGLEEFSYGSGVDIMATAEWQKERGRHPEMYKGNKNYHPTCKPIELCRYLCRLITPPNGIVLDPFAGSGSIPIACVLEGFDYIGIELEQDYVDIANARLEYWGLPKHERERYDRKQRSKERRETENMVGLDRWLG